MKLKGERSEVGRNRLKKWHHMWRLGGISFSGEGTDGRRVGRASIYDVYKILGFFLPLPLFVRKIYTTYLSVNLGSFSTPTPPFCANVIYGSPLSREPEREATSGIIHHHAAWGWEGGAPTRGVSSGRFTHTCTLPPAGTMAERGETKGENRSSMG